MEKITKLIASLSGREVKMYYKFAALSGKNRNNLKIRLFEIAKQNPQISDMEAKKMLGRQSEAAFSMLKSRLQDDITKVILFNGDESRFFSPSFKARYKSLKLIAEAYLLENRDLKTLAHDKIVKAELLVKKYEHITIKNVINEYLLNTQLISRGPSIYKKVKAKVAEDINTHAAVVKAQDLIKQINISSIYGSNKEKTKLELAMIASNEISELIKDNDSIRVKFYYLRSQMEIHELKQDFNGYFNDSLQFLDLVSNNAALRSSDNIGGATMIAALACMHLRNYEEALNFCKKGQPFFFKNSNNDINLRSIHVRALIGLRRYEEAKTTINYIRELKTIKRGSFNYSRWLYYDANIKFLMGDFAGAMNLLKRHSYIKSDRSGWRLGYKILEMMCIVEMHNYDWLPYRLETFRKLISDIKTENTERPKLILKLLNRLSKENFDFVKATKKMQAEFDLLKSNTGDYYCQPEGYEVIRFDLWWEGKLEAAQQKKVRVS